MGVKDGDSARGSRPGHDHCGELSADFLRSMLVKRFTTERRCARVIGLTR
jgi:hypothetical protein